MPYGGQGVALTAFLWGSRELRPDSVCLRPHLLHFARLGRPIGVGRCRFEQPAEQRVGAVGSRQEFGVELAPQHEWMPFEFGDLHQPPVRRKPGEDHAPPTQDLAVGVDTKCFLS